MNNKLEIKSEKIAPILFILTLIMLPVTSAGKSRISSVGESRYFYGPTAIFDNDFPFQVSSKSGDTAYIIAPSRIHCQVQLLSDGAENFKVRSALMKSARQSIDLQSYLLEYDDTGRETFNILLDKMNQGLDSYLIIDAYIRFSGQYREFYREIEASGINMAGFEPLIYTFLNGNYLPSIREFNMRFHEKYLIADDYYAITGGTNIGDQYAGLSRESKEKIRDQDVLLTGQVVEDIHNAFNQNYQEMKNMEQSRPLWIKRYFTNNQTSVSPGVNPGKLRPGEGFLGELQFTDSDATVRLIRSRPRHKETYIYQAYMFLIQSTKQSIVIENSYFVPDRDLYSALKNAARRGVDVTIILDCGKPKDPGQMQPIITRYYYLPLLKAGVHIFEWQTGDNGQGPLHSKSAIFDGEVTLIGSYNLDPRSKYLNSEDVVLIKSRITAQSLRDYIFSEDIPQSEPIGENKAHQWRYPSRPIHLIKLLCALSVKYFW